MSERDIGAERVQKEGHEREMCVRTGVHLAQLFNDFEPTTNQMTCDPKANKMAMCCPAAISF